MSYIKSDRKVLLAISSLIAVAIGGIILFSGNIKISFSKKGDYDAVSNYSESRQAKTYYSKKESQYNDNSYYDDVKREQLRLVTFDPNTADAATLEGLGLARWQVKSILNFRAKGGEFRTPEDFARVYKLTANQYRRIRPYIQISSEYQAASNLLKGNERIVESDADQYSAYKKISTGEYITLNIADTSDLRHVPGIGPFYAREIAHYGKRLGGYVDIDQLSEIQNFPEKAKMFFQIDISKVKKLNVNKLSLEMLRAHPYINYYQARTIVEYRQKHGSISSIDELKLSSYFTEKDLERIKPYIEY